MEKNQAIGDNLYVATYSGDWTRFMYRFGTSGSNEYTTAMLSEPGFFNSVSARLKLGDVIDVVATPGCGWVGGVTLIVTSISHDGNVVVKPMGDAWVEPESEAPTVWEGEDIIDDDEGYDVDALLGFAAYYGGAKPDLPITAADHKTRFAAFTALNSFIWSDSPEGHDYWKGVADKLTLPPTNLDHA